MSRCSVLGTATGYGLDDRGVGIRVHVGSKISTSPYRPARLWGPPNLLSSGYGGGVLSLAVNREGSEADNSPQTIAEVKKTWVYISTPHTPSWRSV
jgi:hypothetical protein